MDTDSSFSSRYKLGGQLDFNDPTYVRRDADNQLYQALKQGKYCYVLNSRQTGKSSLKVNLFHQLRKEGIACADIDLTIFTETKTTSEQFYLDFIVELIGSLKDGEVELDFNRRIWWQEHDDLNPVHRLGLFIQQVILKQISQNLVIFVDEIDSSLKLDFRSDFFALIRSFYNGRSIKSDYKRLTFVLLGVATPSDLIEDKLATPFNIGQEIALKGFTASEVGPLMTGLEGKVDNPSEVMIQILSWTGGQPFLTQRLCDLIVKDSRRITIGMESETVKQIVKSRIIDVWETNDSQQHFNAIKNRIFKADSQNFVISLLEMYKEILIKGEILVTNNSSEQGELKLSGLVISEEGNLRPFNRIYQEVFNLEWINDKLAELRPYKDQLDSWCNAKEEIKERYLLYGKDLDDALKWAEDKNLGKIDLSFLDASRDFQKSIEANFPEGDYQSFGYAMLIWTGGVKSLNQFIFSHISTQHKSIVNPKLIKTVVDLEQWFDTKFKLFDKLKKFKKDESIRNKFEEIIHDLLNTSECNSISLLLKYQEILEKEEVNFDENSLEHQTLINMCLVILDKDNKLRILNKIYEKLLNQDWIKELMEKLCPYKKAFRDWKSLASDSHRQKRAYLLKNNDLKLALEWLGKKLTPKLEVSEIEFIMTSLVSEVWATASPFVQSEAVSLITTLRPSLQGKNNYSDFLLREILQWTKFQISALEKLLGWVNESEIPAENYSQWIESLVRSHLKTCNAQQLSEYIDFEHPYNHRWQKLKKYDKNFFSTLDRFISQENINLEAETLKRLKETLDTNPPLSENFNRFVTVTNFHELVCSFLYGKLSKVNTMIGQKEFDKLLDGIVTSTGGDLESILIFDSEGEALYGNRELKTSNPALYFALFGGDDEGGEAIKNFNYLLNIESALSNFGEKTGRGALSYSIFKLKEGSMMVYLVKIDIPMAICFIAAENVNIGNLRRHGVNNIRKIQDAIS